MKYCCLLVCALLFLNMKTYSQDKRFYHIEDSIKKTINTKTKYKKLTNYSIDSNKFSIDGYELKDSLIYAYWDLISYRSLKGYKLMSNNNSLYLFSSSIRGACGLMVNFTKWLIILPNQNRTYSFLSLSEDKKLVYFDDKTKNICFIEISFGDSFYHNGHDFAHTDYKTTFNVINNNDSKQYNPFIEMYHTIINSFSKLWRILSL